MGFLILDVAEDGKALRAGTADSQDELRCNAIQENDAYRIVGRLR